MEEKYNLEQAQQQAQRLWQEYQVYAYDPQSKAELFSIDTPPPTVSGNLHIGHIFSYLHTDFLARYMRSQGKNVYYPMGYDNNGLATEKFVEKTLGINSRQLSRQDFIQKCIELCTAAEAKFADLWKQIGLSVNPNATYTTISPLAQRISQAAFVQAYQKGYVYRLSEPALFCTTFGTTVAQADLETVDKSGVMHTIVFRCNDGASLQIATTRPELLPACVAIFYHPQDERYTHLAGTMATVPLFGQQVPLLADDLVQPDKGTGLVMCCTFGDQTDVLWFKKHSLPLNIILGADGRLTAKAGFLVGLKVAEARAQVVEALKQANAWLEQKDIAQRVHIYERSKKEIEYLVFPQWFIRTLDFKEQLLACGQKLQWMPEFMHSRYKDWVEHLSWDWCISRQRHYGIPFPVWHCQACGQVLLAALQDLPLDPQVTVYPGGKCDRCASSDILPDTDVMDTWATSSLTPLINAALAGVDAKDFLPMSVRPQAHDIIRTWAFDTMVRCYQQFVDEQQGDSLPLPWKQILVSGHVLADKSGKISKSAGNSVYSPENLLQAYSADAIRYWAAKGQLGVDTIFSPDQLKLGLRLTTKLWNAFRFMQPHLDVAYSDEQLINHPLDAWLIDELQTLFKTYHLAFAKHEYASALEALDQFFWHSFCDNYLELLKDRTFRPERYDASQVASYKATLWQVGVALLQFYAPFVPYVTEALFQELFANLLGLTKPSLHAQTWLLPVGLMNVDFSSHAEQISHLLAVVAAVRKLKSVANLSLKTELVELGVVGKAEVVAQLKQVEPLLQGATKAQAIVWASVDSNAADQENLLVDGRAKVFLP